MPKRLTAAIPIIAAVTLATPAHADSLFGNDARRDRAADTKARGLELRPGFGARVGGYGFRHRDGSSEKWDDCRMQGFGLFGTVDLGDHFFTSLGVDLYHAAPETVAEGMDRDSTHGLLGAGVRMFPHFILSPQLEAGGGLEWTRLSTGAGTTEAVLPVGFLGLGVALHVTPQFDLGAAVRVLATTQPMHAEHASASAALTGDLGQSRQALEGDHGSPELGFGVATQGQIFALYRL